MKIDELKLMRYESQEELRAKQLEEEEEEAQELIGMLVLIILALLIVVFALVCFCRRKKSDPEARAIIQADDYQNSAGDVHLDKP